MTRKIIFLVILILICLGVLFGIWNLSSPSSPSLPGVSPSLPLAPTADGITRTPAPRGEVFPIDTPQGAVSVKNFIPQSKLITGYDGVYITQTNEYDILYFSESQAILISLSQGPVLAVKERAEKSLLALLAISPEDACKLKVEVRTMISTDPDLAGKELGLSFCK